MTAAMLHSDRGPAPEPVVARDLVRRGVPVVPVIVAVAGLLAGRNGALSAGFATAVVLANFALAAWSMAWAARVNLAILMATALFGYLLRLAIIFGVVLVVRDMDWVDMPTLGITLVVTHLGLLFAELRYVSASLAFPDLKPDLANKRFSKEQTR